MFSRWDFARSAEAIFSRWAVKRVCKFLLKKRLGDFILGDIDLDQLDVQLSQGNILLSDLALNVDFLNQKLDGSPVMIKEGSIGSLSIKNAWKLQNCQIEVDELEIVLAPFKVKNDADAVRSEDVDKVDLEQPGISSENGGPLASMVCLDIHEGVKTIAKIVKWFLTSFHVRLKNLIVAFDPCEGLDEKRGLDFCRSLVLRIEEIEYGTCVSEDPNGGGSLFGKAKLTNFVKFHGAVLEFLKMDDVDSGLQQNCCLGTSFSEWHTKSAASLGSTATVLAGASGGFSGKLNLSIPWKNGSLDIRKVDADFSVDPILLNLQPKTIKWIIVVWDSLKNLGAGARRCSNHKSVDSMASTLGSDGKPSKGNFSISTCSSAVQETFPDALVPRTHVIHNWVPLSMNKGAEIELEQDYGTSIDQFFECFDGMRSSQAGSSGIWNWTCSVFNAITVASNLASGSGHIPIEQQNVETNLRASVAEISISLSFRDEDQNSSHNLMDNSKHFSSTYGASQGTLAMSSTSEQCSGSYMSCYSSVDIDQLNMTDIEPINSFMCYLEASCQNLLFNLQICPEKANFEASVMHFRVDEYHESRNQSETFVFPLHNKLPGEQSLLDLNLQKEILGSLPPFPLPVQEPDSETSVDCNVQNNHNGLIKVVLLESFGISSCHCCISSTDVDGRKRTLTSFSINLPPFVLWMYFELVNMLLVLFKNIESYFEENASEEFLSSVVKEQHASSIVDGLESDRSTFISTVPSCTTLQGNILLPQARMILCLTSDCHGKSKFLDKFIIIEFQSAGSRNVSDPFLSQAKSSPKGNPSSSIYFGIGDFDVYLVDSSEKNDVVDEFGTVGKEPASAVKILRGTNRTGDCHSGITMVWQKGPVTGSWMAGRAWSLASSQDQSRNKVAEKSCEFSSVTTGEDSQETSSHIRQELILSSAFFLHVHFSYISFNLDNHSYNLTNHVMDGISNGVQSIVTASDFMKTDQSSPKVDDAFQASILVECNSFNISVILNEVTGINHSMQQELEGSWNRARLSIEKLELLSVSNIGGVSDANLFWLNHGEGALWGSIVDRNERAEEFVLIACRNSTNRRVDRKGANALSFGSAGTTVLYLWNPHLSRSYTSIVVRCGTLVAPGGRMDWVSAICMFFSSHENENSDNDGAQDKSSTNSTVNDGSFYLDLVDVALSYVPHRNTILNSDQLSAQHNGVVEISDEICEQHVAFLLAAASLSLAHHTVAHCESDTSNYTIQLKDLGLLVCESSGLLIDNHGCYASHFRKTGYVNVAHVALVEAVLIIEGAYWRIDCSDSHIDLETCQDTTNGLVRLVSQLQQLYAPDMEDAVAHLQSRWNTVQQTHKNTSDEVTGSSECGSVKSSSETDTDDRVFVGLLDEILENAFSVKEGDEYPGDCGSECNSSLDGGMPYDNSALTIGDALPDLPFTEPMHGPRIRNRHNTSAPKSCLPQIFESYYLSEPHSSSEPTAGNCSTTVNIPKFDVSTRKDIDSGKGCWYQDKSLAIVEDHISKSNHLESTTVVSEDKYWPADSNSSVICREKGKISFKNNDVRWRLYAGLDWPKPRKESNDSSTSKGREKSKCLELTLSGLDVQYSMYPDGKINVSNLSICVEDFHVYDISRDAPWKTVLGDYISKDYPRESCAKAFKLDLEVVRPDPLTPVEDYRLHLEVLPVRLHLDQSQLNFLISFFGKGSFVEESPNNSNDMSGSEMAERGNKTFGSQTIVEEALLPFFQKCDVKPVVLCVDYIPRHVDIAALRRGNYAELLNLVPWKGIELQLKNVCAVGVYGWGSVCETVAEQWLEDISHNQVHKLLKGLAPIKSLFAVSSGTSKLVSLPVKSYRKDKRFLKGVQRGAIAFLKSISLEAVGLGVHLAAGAHEMLLQTEYILSVPPSVSVVHERSRPRATVKFNQPEDAKQGVYQAYESLSDGLGRTASALVGTPLKVYQRGAGAGSALATAVRAAPAAAIAPVAASARALHYTFLGVRNSLDPEHKRESREKYLGPSRK